jgi:hypothetical protein
VKIVERRSDHDEWRSIGEFSAFAIGGSSFTIYKKRRHRHFCTVSSGGEKMRRCAKRFK